MTNKELLKFCRVYNIRILPSRQEFEGKKTFTEEYVKKAMLGSVSPHPDPLPQGEGEDQASGP